MTKTAEAVELTAKQSRFVDEYLVDLNATQAYGRAGYRARGNAAEVNASRLLSNAKVAAAIQQRKDRRSERTQINADYVLHRLVEIDQMDVLDILKDDGGLKPVQEWPKVWRTTLSGLDISTTITNYDEETVENILKKIKWPDKVKNIELIGKHVAVQAWRDKLDHVSSDGSMTPKPTVIELVAPHDESEDPATA